MSLSRIALLIALGMVAAHRAHSNPLLTYSTFLRDAFTPNAITVDSAGSVYLAGSAAVDPANPAPTSFIVKLNPQATQYVYTSILNGQPNAQINAIAADANGNAYVAGSYGPSGSLPTAFAAKLDASGSVLFLIPLGSSSVASAIAVNSAGQIIVSGFSYRSGFPATPGAYSVPDTANRPWIVELNPSGSQVVFSATGIGGSSIALDSSGNIYVAGSTNQLDYPTTPGVYQPDFPAFITCTSSLCQIGIQGANQYVTKVDPSGSKLIFSTAVSGKGTGTFNSGVAVDASGNVYLTGYASTGYPYTITPPEPQLPPNTTASFAQLPFLSKLDATGQNLLFSVSVGGAGLQLDTSGHVYVGGSVGTLIPGGSFAVSSKLPALNAVSSACLPGATAIRSAAYVSQVDAASGDLLGTQFLGGSSLATNAVSLSGATLWVAGSASNPSVPFTPNVLTLPGLTSAYGSSTLRNGAYLAAADFAQTQSAVTPRIDCVLDAADFSPVGAVTRFQLLSIFGANLGPATGVSTTDSSVTNLGGTQVQFGDMAAPLLYVSSSQINLAVPKLPFAQQFSPMTLTVGGLAASRAFPLVNLNPTLFQNTSLSQPAFAGASRFIPLALNADGSVNSPANPAQSGSQVTVFLNGIVPDPDVTNAPIRLVAPNWMPGQIQPLTPFVSALSLPAPALPVANNFSCPSGPTGVCAVDLQLYYGNDTPDLPVGTGLGARASIFVEQ